MSENNQWQTVKGVSIKREKLSAYNLTVETDHTYFIKGAGGDSDGVWVHNDCWHALPKDSKRIKDIDGHKAYQFKDHSGNDITVIQKDRNRFETLDHKGVETILPRQHSWEAARNLALEKVGDLGLDSKPFIGTLEISDGYGKVVGRVSSDGKKGWRLDYDPNKGMHTQDLKKVQERQEMARVIGEIANNAISIATYEEREKMNKLGLEKFKLEEQKKALGDNDANRAQVAALDKQIGTITQEINKTQQKIDNNVGIGSPNGMAIRAVTAALQAAAQNDTNGAIVALASPYLNKQIHDMTKENTAKDKATNLIAHALLSAVEFQVTGKDPLTGAVAGVTGEATATILTKALYDKTPDQLTASEKENISTLSQIAGGLAGALTAKANNTAEQQGGTFLTATAGAETAKRAVENNNLLAESAKLAIRPTIKLLCSKECMTAIGMVGTAYVLSNSEIEESIQAGISGDPAKIAKLTDEQRAYLNNQVLLGKESFFVGTDVWIPNADGGFSPVDPNLVTTTIEGKPIIDPRIFVNHTGGIEYPSDYNLPTNTGGNQVVSNDKEGHILAGGESQIGDWRDNALFARDKTIDKAAERLGYKQRIPPQKAPFNSHGQDVYWNGKNYITPDVDGHNVSEGWKLFDRKGQRLGTYDKDLNRVKD
ncbi:hypothetical protein BKK52_12740 [Rodentibacter trehalosifermentans]|uniref:Uncharacterized protein n=2 Tax=Rodentibacter trehalosifermentans TaxID=1908263 RepID=A0A1V3ISV8_9PAST|nr:hypothetical protein BKK52_12740 [Rodentibacter trehalosifermentans]